MSQQIIPGAVVYLKSSPDTRMTIGYSYGNGFYDCVWLGSNKEMQVRKLHASMLLTTAENAIGPDQKTIGFQQLPAQPEQKEFYTPITLTWL